MYNKQTTSFRNNMEKKKRLTETGTSLPDEKYRIKIVPNGPYLVYGNPTIQQEILTLNEEEIPWEYATPPLYAVAAIPAITRIVTVRIPESPGIPPSQPATAPCWKKRNHMMAPH